MTRYKIKQELLTIFEHSDCAGIFNLNDLNSTHFASDFGFFEQWLQNKKHANMQFLERNFDVRKNPTLILKNAQTAIIFLFPYAHGHRVRKKHDTLSSHGSTAGPSSIVTNKLISKYAYAKDYHKIIKAQLNQYAILLQKKLNHAFTYRPVVDSIPFFERAYARETGLGFIGKNTLLIRPGMGSFFFIGTLLTDLDISMLANVEEKNHPIFSLNCGECTRCIDACPTQALDKNYTLDANKCLSYLTIEHRDIVPTHFLKKMDKTIYGCDICQDVCPYNFVTQEAKMLTEFKKIHTPLLILNAEDIALMTEVQYQQWFGGTAMTRAKYEGLVRNSLYYLYANKSTHLKNILSLLQHSPYPLIQKTVQQISLENENA